MHTIPVKPFVFNFNHTHKEAKYEFNKILRSNQIKRFDEYGNCFIGVDIEECYKISHVCNTESIGSHTPRYNEFKIVNERRLSCVNDIEMATYSEIGDRVVIKAYELCNMSGHPINRYQTVDFRNWH